MIAHRDAGGLVPPTAATRPRAGSRTPSWPTRLAVRWLLGLSGLAVLVYLAVPDHAAKSAVFGVNRALVTVAILVGARHARPAVRREWRYVTAAALIWGATHVVSATIGARTGGDVRLTLASAVVTILAYVLCGVGMVRLARIEGMHRDSAVWLESAAAAIAYLATWWLVAQRPPMASMGPGIGVLDVVYPLGDVVNIACAIVLLSSRSGHDPSNSFLASGALLGAVGDLMFAAYTSGSLPSLHTVFPVVYMMEFTTMAAAAALSWRSSHPSQVHSMSGPGALALVLAGLLPGLALGADSVESRTPVTMTRLLVVAAASLAIAGLVTVRVRRLVQRTERLALDLEATARTDELTGLPNRRAGQRMLAEAIEHSGHALSVAMIDLDLFKTYNDTFGHLQGDHLLRAAGVAWAAALDGDGMLYRYGGEEFVVILPGLVDSDADLVIDAMRAATPRGQTFSAGVVRARTDDDALALLGRADRALYAAKAAGRGITRRSA